MNSFIQLKIDGDNDSTYKRLRVVFGTGSYPHSTEQGRVINRTTTGRLSKQIGPAYKYWYGSFRVKIQEDTGYATLDDLYKWMTSDVPADHRLVMRPWKWEVIAPIAVVNINVANFNSLVWWVEPQYPIVLEQILIRNDTHTQAVVTVLISTTEARVDDDTFITTTDPVEVTTSGPGIPVAPPENVSFVTGVDPQPQVPVMESSGGFAIVPFRLEAR